MAPTGPQIDAADCLLWRWQQPRAPAGELLFLAPLTFVWPLVFGSEWLVVRASGRQKRNPSGDLDSC